MLCASMNWPRFWAAQILLITLIFRYRVIAELARVTRRNALTDIIIIEFTAFDELEAMADIKAI